MEGSSCTSVVILGHEMFMLQHGKTQVLLTSAAEIFSLQKCWLYSSTPGTNDYWYIRNRV